MSAMPSPIRSRLRRIGSALLLAGALTGLVTSALPAVAAIPGYPILLVQIDRTVVAGGQITLIGWAVDQDRPSTSVTMQTSDSTGAVHSVTANQPRPDVNATFGITGAHGYTFTFTEPNTATSDRYYCLSIVVPGQQLSSQSCFTVHVTYSPFGSVDALLQQSGQPILLQGWAFDPDAPSTSATVHTYVDGTLVSGAIANLPRADVNAAYRVTGQHGFSIPVTPVQGTHSYCVYGINVGAGGNDLIGCRTATVNGNPIGYQDPLLASGPPTVVHGWAFDPDAPTASIYVDIYVDGTTFVAHVPTTVPRPDVNAVEGITGTHGFSATVPSLPGMHQYCVYGINVGPGVNTLLQPCWNTLN
jgi:hypothetical protein